MQQSWVGVCGGSLCSLRPLMHQKETITHTVEAAPGRQLPEKPPGVGADNQAQGLTGAAGNPARTLERMPQILRPPRATNSGQRTQ